jgi:hypothetical protein
MDFTFESANKSEITCERSLKKTPPTHILYCSCRFSLYSFMYIEVREGGGSHIKAAAGIGKLGNFLGKLLTEGET